MKPGYYRSNDCWLYLTTSGTLYFVSGPDTVEPEWKKIEPFMDDDAKLAAPDDEEIPSFEAVRVSYGIPQ
jgi:hypothetical protein